MGTESPSEKEPSTIKELQVPRMANDVEVSSAFPVTMVDFTTTQLLAWRVLANFRTDDGPAVLNPRKCWV